MILVTGASGFIGNSIAESLGPSSINLARASSLNKSSNIFNFDLVKGQASELADKMQSAGIETIIHAAAITPWSSEKPNFTDDLSMAQTIAESANQAGIDRVIYLSGWNVYDMHSKPPPYSEDTAVNPVGEYGKSKVEVENYLTKKLESSKLIILRLASIYGPGQVSKGLIPNLSNLALREGKIMLNARHTKRDYMFVDDLVKAVNMLCNTNHLKSEIINLGSGITTSVEDVAGAIIKACGQYHEGTIQLDFSDDIKESDITDNLLDVSKARSMGILNETTGFVQGIEKYVEWLRHENIF